MKTRFGGRAVITASIIAFSTFLPNVAAAASREVCSQNGTLLWRDTRIFVTRGQYNYLEKPISTPFCSCIDLTKKCIIDNAIKDLGRGSCDSMESECNQALGTGGSFCIANQWGGQTCYK